MPVSLVSPLPPGEPARQAAEQIAGAYLQFASIIGHREARRAFISDKIRPDRVVCAFDGGRPLGFISLRYDGLGPFTFAAQDFTAFFGLARGLARLGAMRLLERREKPDEIFIDGFFVSPDTRGGGVGAKLVAEAEAIGRRARKSVFRVRVRASTPRAGEFYCRQGFSEEGPSEITRLAQLAGVGPVATYAKRLL